MEGAVEQPADPVHPRRLQWARALVGAVLGGVAGYVLCGWLATQGFYAVALPGVLLGIGSAWLIGGRSLPFSIGCGLAGLALGLLAEWANFPFIENKSLAFFLTHLSGLRPFTFLMIGLGGLAAFWFTWRAHPAGAGEAR